MLSPARSTQGVEICWLEHTYPYGTKERSIWGADTVPNRKVQPKNRLAVAERITNVRTRGFGGGGGGGGGTGFLRGPDSLVSISTTSLA